MEESKKISEKNNPVSYRWKIKILLILALCFFAVSLLINLEKRSNPLKTTEAGENNFSLGEVKKLFSRNDKEVEAKIGQNPLTLLGAITEEERIRGLSYREPLPDRTGLLFTFDYPDFNGIWMKDMKFSIDIMWFDSNLKIIDIKEDARPDSYPDVFYPKEKSLYVVEVNSGFVQDHKIKIGDRLFFSQNQ